MKVKFEKYHGLGNDFILMEDADIRGLDPSALAVRLCARTTGIGADGLIIAKRDKGKPLEMIIYNSDGSLAPMCGNGIRCFALYALSHELVPNGPTLIFGRREYPLSRGQASGDSFPVLTGAGEMVVRVVSESPFIAEVNMGAPDFSPQAAGVVADTGGEPFLQRVIDVEGYGSVTVSTIFMGTYHTVVWSDAAEGFPDLGDDDGMKAFGRAVQTNGVFGVDQNVNMARFVGTDEIALRTYERGAGLTDACGTGACATVVIAAKEKKIKGEEATVHLKHGDIVVRLEGGNVFMRGPAAFIAGGEAEVD